jgi:type I restriction enzyme, R subunit
MPRARRSSATSSTRSRVSGARHHLALLSTGVDAQTCRLIVLDREVGSMTEFKQIVGRGTRVHEDTRKYYFTLIDFRGATSHFADPDFDGEPVQIYEPRRGRPITPPEDVRRPTRTATAARRRPARTRPSSMTPPDRPAAPEAARKKIYVDGVGASIIAERVEYLDENGKLVTESLRDFTKKALRKRFASLDDFLKRWKAPSASRAIIEELEAEGLPLDAIAEELGKDLDPFDLICHVAFDAKPLTRRERAENVKKRDVFTNTADRPAPCSTRCWPNTPTRACSTSTMPTCSRSPPSAPWAASSS